MLTLPLIQNLQHKEEGTATTTKKKREIAAHHLAPAAGLQQDALVFDPLRNFTFDTLRHFIFDPLQDFIFNPLQDFYPACASMEQHGATEEVVLLGTRQRCTRGKGTPGQQVMLVSLVVVSLSVGGWKVWGQIRWLALAPTKTELPCYTLYLPLPHLTSLTML